MYEGWQVSGKPSKVFLRGKLIVDADRWLGEQGKGQFNNVGYSNPTLTIVALTIRLADHLEQLVWIPPLGAWALMLPIADER